MPNQTLENRVVDLAYLFSAPLVSTIEADVLAAKKFAQFIEEYGFEKEANPPEGESGRFGRLRTFSFGFQRKDPSTGGLADATLSVPALSMVPLPALQISEAEFSYRVRILGALATQPPSQYLRLGGQDAEVADGAQTPPTAEDARTLPSANQYRFRAMLAADADRAPNERAPSLDANLRVRVKMRQADLPAGLSALLNVMGESIHTRRQDDPRRTR